MIDGKASELVGIVARVRERGVITRQLDTALARAVPAFELDLAALDDIETQAPSGLRRTRLAAAERRLELIRQSADPSADDPAADTASLATALNTYGIRLGEGE